MDWYLMALKKYAEFQGRSQRKEYWMFTLFNFLAMVLLGAVGALLGGGGEGGLGDVLQGLYGLGVLVPGIAVTVRRLHDIGKSGWWGLVALIPLIGSLILIYFAVKDSQPETNEYGPNPKAASI
ncbi:MAG TPA: DUF805 domain-containing protein [Zoogloea sp.]|jgi:uncharacterized membrane protein YhaH (DUF805 family)|uniref:DUF805 domain-containing protein n=1 Tax=Zoogloea sp. TaxID=49181 RepID=UPI002C57623C|nr:DUF805 domain-containing protein [Zoogloea sp.]HOB45429.1 DUF805 domain-containing protein [Zoogloea sp.]HQA11414.1 DUF805 domain-containing protein [Zoogloea sp.]HQE40079.1 DUF805 domain-containing protein [Zoogloea sp.]